MQLSGNLKLGLIAFLLADLLLVAIFVSAYLIRSERQEALELRELGVTIFPQPRPVEAFELVDQYGGAFTLHNLQERWSLLFFGFTSCPDICPLTLAELGQFYALQQENGSANLPQVVLVTVDPERDNPATMALYLESFHEDFIGLSGDKEALSALAEQMYVVANATVHGDLGAATNSAQDYQINHSGHISVINPAGELYAVLRLPHRDKDLLTAYQILLGN
ncbi:MAG: SCO family protein [Proteobacteria bacterium]|nr:SCO family protein [Pseudomonadota bacterium]